MSNLKLLMDLLWSIPRGVLATVSLVYIWLIYGSAPGEHKRLKNTDRKIKLYMSAISFMVYSKDSKGVGKKNSEKDPDSIKAQVNKGEARRKRIVFLRHGESDWNDVFNKGFGPMIIVRLIRAMWRELLCYASEDSVFLDSPLNQDGIEQALDLRKFLKNKEQVSEVLGVSKIIDVLNGNDTSVSSIIVSSCLRRAIATTVLGLWDRIEKTNEKIHILSSCQEISRNVDTYSLAAPNTVADLPFKRVVDHCGGAEKFNPESIFNTTDNFGNKTRSFYGQKRFKSFNEWAFNREEDIIIVGGHSLWFKYYFQTFLPYNDDHKAKKKKLKNSGAVVFDLHCAKAEDGTVLYRVDPHSLLTVYRGFDE